MTETLKFLFKQKKEPSAVPVKHIIADSKLHSSIAADSKLHSSVAANANLRPIARANDGQLSSPMSSSVTPREDLGITRKEIVDLASRMTSKKFNKLLELHNEMSNPYVGSDPKEQRLYDKRIKKLREELRKEIDIVRREQRTRSNSCEDTKAAVLGAQSFSDFERPTRADAPKLARASSTSSYVVPSSSLVTPSRSIKEMPVALHPQGVDTIHPRGADIKENLPSVISPDIFPETPRRSLNENIAPTVNCVPQMMPIGQEAHSNTIIQAHNEFNQNRDKLPADKDKPLVTLHPRGVNMPHSQGVDTIHPRSTDSTHPNFIMSAEFQQRDLTITLELENGEITIGNVKSFRIGN